MYKSNVLCIWYVLSVAVTWNYTKYFNWVCTLCTLHNLCVSLICGSHCKFSKAILDASKYFVSLQFTHYNLQLHVTIYNYTLQFTITHYTIYNYTLKFTITHYNLQLPITIYNYTLQLTIRLYTLHVTLYYLL